MDFDLFSRIVREASKYGARSFSLHLFGEPLLYPLWFEAIRFIKECNRRHTVLLTTNGTMLERGDYLPKLLASGVDKVVWSWRPEAKFSQDTKTSLRRMGKFTVRLIRGVVPKEEFEEWSKWPSVEVRDMHNYGANIDTTKWEKNIDAENSSSASKPTNSLSRWPCYHLWLAPAVAWNGDILMCCSDPHRKEVLGHYPQDSLTKVWMGPRLQAIRESHLRGQYGGICTNCDVWKSYPDIFFKWQKK